MALPQWGFSSPQLQAPNLSATVQAGNSLGDLANKYIANQLRQKQADAQIAYQQGQLGLAKNLDARQEEIARQNNALFNQGQNAIKFGTQEAKNLAENGNDSSWGTTNVTDNTRKALADYALNYYNTHQKNGELTVPQQEFLNQQSVSSLPQYQNMTQDQIHNGVPDQYVTSKLGIYKKVMKDGLAAGMTPAQAEKYATSLSSTGTDQIALDKIAYDRAKDRNKSALEIYKARGDAFAGMAKGIGGSSSATGGNQLALALSYSNLNKNQQYIARNAQETQYGKSIASKLGDEGTWFFLKPFGVSNQKDGKEWVAKMNTLGYSPRQINNYLELATSKGKFWNHDHIKGDVLNMSIDDTVKTFGAPEFADNSNNADIMNIMKAQIANSTAMKNNLYNLSKQYYTDAPSTSVRYAPVAPSQGYIESQLANQGKLFDYQQNNSKNSKGSSSQPSPAKVQPVVKNTIQKDSTVSPSFPPNDNVKQLDSSADMYKLLNKNYYDKQQNKIINSNENDSTKSTSLKELMSLKQKAESVYHKNQSSSARIFSSKMISNMNKPIYRNTEQMISAINKLPPQKKEEAIKNLSPKQKLLYYKSIYNK